MKLINSIKQKFKQEFYAVPIGTIFSFASSNPPPGAFILNGQIIYNCQTLFPVFWNWLISESTNNNIRVVTSATFESELSTCGNCGAFVIDTTTGSVRLPSITTGFIQGTNSNIGNSESAGLPNITGSVGDAWGQHNSNSGAFTRSAATDRWVQPGQIKEYNASDIFYFDASNSNSIYGNSNTVQPNSVHYSFCIKVYNATSKLSTANASQILSELQSKVGINADNFTAVGKDKIIDMFKIPVIEGTNIIENTLYQADKSGLFGVYYIGASDSTVLLKASSKIWNEAPAWSWGHSANAVSLNNQIGNSVIYVPKGWYYEAIVDSSKKSAFVGILAFSIVRLAPPLAIIAELIP